MNRDAAFYLHTKVYNFSKEEIKFTVPGLPHLLIGDMLPRSRMETVQEKKVENISLYKKLQALACAQFH